MDAQYPVGQHFDVEPNHYFADDLSPTHTSPPTSALAWPSHRTSSTRDDFARVKHESPMNDRANGNSSRSSDDPMPSTSDFVKKLYKMLEDPTFQSVVSWGPQGDCFVVKDMNEFTKSILPRMFKHSNFASFVRQLNKYDFHKVKNTDDNQFGEHSWTFRHPDFHADRRDALENIKRKVPAQRKTQSASIVPLSSLPYPSSTRGRSTSPVSLGNLPPHLSTMHGNTYASVPVLQAETQRLREENDDLRGRIRNLERNYESVLVEMVAFQRGIAQQDGLMQNMISYFLANQNGE